MNFVLFINVLIIFPYWLHRINLTPVTYYNYRISMDMPITR